MDSCGIINIPSVMEIDADIQAILRFGFTDSTGGIIDGEGFTISYALEMRLGAVTYIPSFIKSCSDSKC
jgi:hypothetical protein